MTPTLLNPAIYRQGSILLHVALLDAVRQNIHPSPLPQPFTPTLYP
jgi:hypothetical protein